MDFACRTTDGHRLVAACLCCRCSELVASSEHFVRIVIQPESLFQNCFSMLSCFVDPCASSVGMLCIFVVIYLFFFCLFLANIKTVKFNNLSGGADVITKPVYEAQLVGKAWLPLYGFGAFALVQLGGNITAASKKCDARQPQKIIFGERALCTSATTCKLIHICVSLSFRKFEALFKLFKRGRQLFLWHNARAHQLRGFNCLQMTQQNRCFGILFAPRCDTPVSQ